MDNIAKQLSNVSVYDMKAYVRKAQNAVLNLSDMEAKVREATNNEPWGTPTSVMQQIAEGTNNYQQFHEIMPFIYRRFTEKTASEWRQIYKALQLLDYLVRNGSERVVDYARSHLSVIEMLRHFSYIDSKGTDQGASIRKRSEELVNLLGSTESLRAERKRSKQLNAKTGFSAPGGGFGGSGKKYGGISSDAYREMKFGGAPSQQVFGDGGGFDGSNHIVTAARESGDFEEYSVEETAGGASSSGAKVEQPAASNDDDDDDFADFQSAPAASAASTSTSQPLSKSNILDLFDAPMPSSTAGAQPAAAMSASFLQISPGGNGPPSTQISSLSTSAVSSAPAAAKPAPKVDLFDSLWETSKTSPALSKQPSAASRPAPVAAAASSNQSQSSPAAAKPQDAPIDLLDF